MLRRRKEPKDWKREGLRRQWLHSLCPQTQFFPWTQPCLLNLLQQQLLLWWQPKCQRQNQQLQLPTSIPVTVYNLVQDKFKGIPYPTRKSQEEEGPSTSNCNNPQEEQQPEAAVTATAPHNRKDTPQPNTMPASMNMFDARASWPISPIEAPTVIKMEKAEKIPPRVAAIPHTIVNKPPQSKAEKMCGWEPHCPICPKSTPNHKVGSSDEKQDNLQRKYYPQSPQCSPSYDILDRFSQQLKLEREWNERMEQLNNKYNLDYYSSSESDLESELEHKSETLI